MTVLKETLCGKGEKKKQTLVTVERARELGKLRAHAHDLLAAQELLRNDGGSTTNKVATQVNHDGLTLEHLQKHTKQKQQQQQKKDNKEKKKTTKQNHSFFFKAKWELFFGYEKKTPALSKRIQIYMTSFSDIT